MKTILKIYTAVSIGGWAGGYASAFFVAAHLPLTINVY